MKFKKAMFPSLFTIFNMFAGFLAIVSIFEGEITRACWLIFFAAVFDGMDGKLARLIGNSTDFGVEFDSLADVISFCLAPSFLIYRLYAVDLGVLGAIISFFPLMFGAIRLARFNVQTTTTPMPVFIGLPTPMNAIALLSFPLFNYATIGNAGNAKIILPYMVCLSFLMVSHVPYTKMPKLTFKEDLGNTIHLIIVILGFVLIAIFTSRALLIMTFLFVLSGIVRWMAGTEEDEQVYKPLTK